MKAWTVASQGEPRDVMAMAAIAEPQALAGQLLVRVRAVALGFPDVLLCRGTYQSLVAAPFTPGVELCGEVVALGPGVLDFAVGDRAIGTSALPRGALAEYALMHSSEAYRAPGSLDDDAAAALHTAYQTAWFGLHRRAGLRAGDSLLVLAAAGGIGSAAVQLGRAAGATVIGVVGGRAKVAVAERLGADVVIDRLTQDFVSAVKEVTQGRGADVVFDPVGGEACLRAMKCVAFEGRIVLAGFASGAAAATALNRVLVRNYSILGLHLGRYREHLPGALREAHAELTALADTGTVAPLVGGRLRLDEAAAGLARLAAGETVGRLVVIP